MVLSYIHTTFLLKGFEQQKAMLDENFFFNENAISKIFFYDIGYANLWRALRKRRAISFNAKYLFMLFMRNGGGLCEVGLR